MMSKLKIKNYFKLFLISLIFLLNLINVNIVRSENKNIVEKNKFKIDELIKAGNQLFNNTSANIASIIEIIFSKLGKPTAYIIGEETSGSFIIGIRYGKGYIYFKNGLRHKIYWQGSSIGTDIGGDVSKTMVLVYNINNFNELINRFSGIDGSAYIIGGIGITYQQYNNIILGIIRTGIGARFGVNIGYLKYSKELNWNPF